MKQLTVYEFLKHKFNLKGGEVVKIGEFTFELLVKVPLEASIEDQPPTGLLKMTHPSIMPRSKSSKYFPGEHVQLIGLRAFWIDFGMRFPAFNDFMNEVTDDPGVGGSWRNAYTEKPDGWNYADFTQRAKGESSNTGLREGKIKSRGGKVWDLSCDDIKLQDVVKE